MALPGYAVATISNLLGLTVRRVQQLSKEGVIPKSEKGKYDLVKSVRGYVGYLQDRAFGKEAMPIDQHEAKGRLVSANARLAELELAEKEKKLVEVEVVEKELNKAFTVVRRRILSMPTKLTPVIQAEATGVGIRNVLEAEATEILQELSSYDPESGKTDARPSGANGNVKKAIRKPKAAGKTKRKRVGRKKPTA
jgi:hypothetical protein